MISISRKSSVGGGGGGGGSSRIFSVFSGTRQHSVGGGVVTHIFTYLHLRFYPTSSDIRG